MSILPDVLETVGNAATGGQTLWMELFMVLKELIAGFGRVCRCIDFAPSISLVTAAGAHVTDASQLLNCFV